MWRYWSVAALSGFSALVFENLWFRRAGLVLGSGVWSTALVLAAFMAGLALGNLLVIRLEAKLRRPLAAYAAIEIVIGLSGLAALFAFSALVDPLGAMLRPFLTSPFELNLFRLAVSFALLMVPTLAMGATLPVLMHALAGRTDAFGGKLGTVYGANTIGAVLGAIACEFLLVPALGIAGSGLVAAGMNGLAAVVAWRLGVSEFGARDLKAAGPLDLKVQGSGGGVYLVAAFFSGAVFLSFEVASFRFLLLFFTSLGANFAAMLAVVLAGLAAGGVIAGVVIRRIAGVDELLPVAALVAGTVLAGSYAGFHLVLDPALSLPRIAAVFAATLFLTLPISIVSGFLFAALGHAVRRDMSSDARATGWLTAANTIGAALGSMLTGFYLIPAIGLENCFRAAIVAYGVVGVVLAVPSRARVQGSALLVAGAVFVMALAFFPAGRMDATFYEFPIAALRAAGEEPVALKEGQSETLQYLRADALGRPDYYRLVTNNHSMAATDLRSRRYMRLFAHMPAVLHPQPGRAVLLGLGLGVTAKALTEDPRLTTIDVVDVSRDVPALLPIVSPNPRDNPLNDPRVRLHTEDGRFFLMASSDGYDVITAEPPPPHHAGISNLYSREFFQLVSDRLNPGGIATYWLPVHDLKLAEAQAIVRAFLDAFPDGSLWTGSGLDWILMGTKPPRRQVTEDAFRAWWAAAPIGGELRWIGLDDPESLGSLFIADGDRLAAWVGNTPPLTDNYPRRIDLQMPRDAQDTAAFVGLMTSRDAIANFDASPTIRALWPERVRVGTRDRFARQALVNAILSLPGLRVEDIGRMLGAFPRDPLVIKALFWRHFFDFDRVRTLLEAEPDLQGAGLAEYRAQLALMSGNPREAAAWLDRSVSPRAPYLRTIRMYALSAGDAAPGAPK
jgi:spermidine synthase